MATKVMPCSHAMRGAARAPNAYSAGASTQRSISRS